MNLDWTGSLRGRVCETLRGLRGVFCSQSARRRLRTDRAHVLAWRTPRIARFVFFFNARVTSWLHVWFGIRQEGVKPCRMVPSMKGRGTRQLHDVTGKVPRAWLIIAAQMRDVRVATLDAHLNFKKRINSENKKQPSLSGEQDSQVRGEIPPVWAQDTPS